MPDKIPITEFSVFVRDNTICTLCRGAFSVITDEWQNPRPCPICKGVGQIPIERMPTDKEMAMAMLYHWASPRSMAEADPVGF